MKNLLFAFVVFLVALAAVPAFGQTQNTLRRRCPGVNPVPAYASVTVTVTGNVVFTACNGGTITGVTGTGISSLNGLATSPQLFGVPAANDSASWLSSVATHTLRLPITAVSGASRPTFFPYFDAANTLAKAPYSWDSGTNAFAWNNAAGTANFEMNLRSDLGTGRFQIGNHNFAASNYLDVDGDTATITLNSLNFVDLGDTQGAGNNTRVRIDDGSSLLTARADNGVEITSTGEMAFGDNLGLGNSSVLTVDDSVSSITANAPNVRLGNTATGYLVNRTNDEHSIVTSNSLAGLTINSDGAVINNNFAHLYGGRAFVGALLPSGPFGNGTYFRVQDGANQFTFANTANTSSFNLLGVQNYFYQRTITAGGTTGDRTINQPAGTVNFAAAATAITVTNSIVNANSIIHATARTNDATCSVKNVVPAAGSFVINMTAACTAETSVGFFVTN